MKKYSVYIDKALRGADENGQLGKNPEAFRNINAVVPFVIEMAMTGLLPKSIVPLVGNPDCISVEPKAVHESGKKTNRVRFTLFSGDLGHICLGANIEFIDEGGRSLLTLVAAADSDGIRYVRKFRAPC